MSADFKNGDVVRFGNIVGYIYDSDSLSEIMIVLEHPWSKACHYVAKKNATKVSDAEAFLWMLENL